MGTAVSMVARRLLIRMRSTLFCRLSRYILRSTSAARSMAASTEPKRSIRSRAPLSPMPGAPGMLSMASPFSANRSATCAGITPRNSLTFAGPYHSSSLAGFSMESPAGGGGGRGGNQKAYRFFQDWTSGRLPRMLIVDTQDANPYYDDSYAVNSANLGPYGDALI